MDNSQKQALGRRDFLALSGVAGATLATTGRVQADTNRGQRRRVLRVAHLTDIHVQPERDAGRGLTAVLHHVQELDPAPQLILTGGDTIMDSFGANDARTTVQWELFHHIMRNECSLPVRSCIGNHDVWGWNKDASHSTGKEILWGKNRAVEALKLERRYYSFDSAGWHFIVLDSTHTDGGSGYVARLDESQFQWLAQDLQQVPADRPVLVLTHQPILSAASFFDGDNEKEGDWLVPAAWMHIDARRIKDLFKQHPQVKLCLSGHLHLVDRVDYCHVSYICNGAVCGAWWKGDNQECDEGYGLLDLYDDGSFDHEYVSFGWKPAQA